MTRDQLIEVCARVAHEANRAFCIAQGDNSQPPWDEASEEAKFLSRDGVRNVLLDVSAQELHDIWAKNKEAAGWVYGPERDNVRKIHPCLVPYSELPLVQQVKDSLFSRVVKATFDSLVLTVSASER